MIRLSTIVRAASFVPLLGLAACSGDDDGAEAPAGDATAVDTSPGGSVTAPVPSSSGDTTIPTESDATTERPLDDGPDTTPPQVTAAAVEGNFGLVKLTAIATDDVRLEAVRFLIDGMPPRRAAAPAFVSTDPADQYVYLLDTTGLADGPHTLIVRAEDRSRNVADSAEVVFEVDSSDGVTELAANESSAAATVLASTQRQIAGHIDNVTTLLGEAMIVETDLDYYRMSLDAGEQVSIDMLSRQVDFFFVSVEDASGAPLSNDGALMSSFVSNVSYTNGATPQDVYIRVSSGPIDFETDNQYKLSLSYR